VARVLEEASEVRIGRIVLGDSDAVLIAPAIPRRRRVRMQDLSDLARFAASSGWPFDVDFIDEAHPGLARRATALGLALTRPPLLAASPRPGSVAHAVTFLADDPPGLLAAHRLLCRALGRDPSTTPTLAAELVRRQRRGSLAAATCGRVEEPSAIAAYRRAGPHAELVDVATDREHCGQGLASTLLLAPEAHAARTGAHRLLAVAADGGSAAWYGHRGYAMLGTLVALRAMPAG
jgi:GNAT superfamily N-acetyltransferase